MNFEDLENLTLETLITRHRQRFDLRYSIQSDLKSVECDSSDPADGRVVKDEFVSWVFITFEDREQNISQVILTGVRPDGYVGTSPVVHYNREQGWVVTQSGSFYMLSGAAGEVPSDISRVMFIAGLFNAWGIGQVLGMPPVFF
ncbi:hypothetical protein V5T82_15255 [Magnetovibrio sp. PR-2]|uniref:hypothetical protein n=1 Tax=Magnetovibrio sp. PR-2 TaxID=3120356 RepID=UPI002FCE4F46